MAASYANCGNINISNVSITSYGSYDIVNNASPGIGSAGDAACGTITIENAIVHAFGISYPNFCTTPGIGCGYSNVLVSTSIPTVIITNSNIYAHRGSDGYSDYIGWAGDSYGYTSANSAINPGAGSIKSSTVYCYTGDTLDKTVVYDENGGGKEQ